MHARSCLSLACPRQRVQGPRNNKTQALPLLNLYYSLICTEKSLRWLYTVISATPLQKRDQILCWRKKMVDKGKTQLEQRDKTYGNRQEGEKPATLNGTPVIPSEPKVPRVITPTAHQQKQNCNEDRKMEPEMQIDCGDKGGTCAWSRVKAKPSKPWCYHQNHGRLYWRNLRSLIRWINWLRKWRGKLSMNFHTKALEKVKRNTERKEKKVKGIGAGTVWVEDNYNSKLNEVLLDL